MEALTINECEIMNLFWSQGRPLSKSDIVALSPQKSWKERSIHVLLNSLLAKGMIQISGFVSTKTNYGRTFLPCCTQEEYVSFMLQAGGHTVKVNPARLITALHQQGELDEATLSELETVIQDLKSQQEQPS